MLALGSIREPSKDSANSRGQKLGSISPIDDSREKSYEKYMQKQDAKLREEWMSKRAQKEAKMKAMHDSLERSQAEMKAKLAGSGDKQDSVLAHRRVEKLRSFNVSSTMKNQGQAVDPSREKEKIYKSLSRFLMDRTGPAAIIYLAVNLLQALRNLY